MNKAGIRILRFPYEEPYHLHLLMEASNGRVRGALDYYCNAEDLQKLGTKLAEFKDAHDAEIVYQLGSENATERCAFYLSLQARSLDSSGHCSVHIRFNNNQEPPEHELTDFSITCNIGDLNRLGSLLLEFSKLEHRVLEWHIQEGALIKNREDLR